MNIHFFCFILTGLEAKYEFQYNIEIGQSFSHILMFYTRSFGNNLEH